MQTEKETSIQSAICEYLARRKHMFWRSNNMPRFDMKRKIFFKMPSYGLKGVPDIIVIHDGYFIGLEVKRKGTKQSTDQKEFERRCKEAGGEYRVVRSIDDVQEIGL